MKSVNWIVFTISLLGVGYWLEAAIIPFFIAFILAYLIHPLVEKLSRKFHHKNIIIATIVGLLMYALFAVMVIIIPVAYKQTSLLVSKIPQYKAYLQPIITEEVSKLNPEIASRLSDALHASFDKIVSVLASSVNNLLGYFFATVSTIAMIFIIPVILFYFLRDFNSCKASIENSLPKEVRGKFSKLINEVGELMSAYIRGQLKVCLVLSSYYSFGLTLVGLDLGLLLGIISGFSIILPFVGYIFSFCLSMIFGYINFGFSGQLIAIAVLYIFGAILEGGYLTPKIIGGKIGLHPLWIIFAVLAGGTLFGFVGMLLAIPVAGIIRICLKLYLTDFK